MTPLPTPETPWIVAKFGGTSVSSLECWQAIARLVTGHQRAGKRSMVVCSALAGVTDALERLLSAAARGDDCGLALDAIWQRHERLATELGIDAKRELAAPFAELRERAIGLAGRATVAPRDRAAVMAYGELMSTRLGAAWLRGQGLSAEWRDARGMLRAEAAPADTAPAQLYLSAVCDVQPDPELRFQLEAAAPVVVTQGFIASDAAGDTVLLGRGGSDTSAAYLASKLQAARLEIWTDVHGMFTANPNVVNGARLVPELTYAEAQSLAGLGAKVLHPRCLSALQDQHIPLALGATRRPEEGGTTINGMRPRVGIKAIVSRRDLCLLSMRRPAEWQPVGFMADVASCFQRFGVSMDLLSSSPGEIRATIDTAAFPDVLARLDGLVRELGEVSEVKVDRGVASVSLVGHNVAHDRGRYSAAAEVLRDTRARLVSHAADESSITYVVDDDAAADALVQRLHAALFEQQEAPDSLGPSWSELTAGRSKRPSMAAKAVA